MRTGPEAGAVPVDGMRNMRIQTRVSMKEASTVLNTAQRMLRSFSEKICAFSPEIGRLGTVLALSLVYKFAPSPLFSWAGGVFLSLILLCGTVLSFFLLATISAAVEASGRAANAVGVFADNHPQVREFLRVSSYRKNKRYEPKEAPMM
jgi:hypothetical protein